MTRHVLDGVSGADPLGFMASVGLLRLLDGCIGGAQLGFLEDGTFRAFITTTETVDIPEVVAADAASTRQDAWNLRYPKKEKNGIKLVSDLKAKPEAFSGFLANAVQEWIDGRDEAAAYAAAFATDVALDGNGNTKPTAFHFTAANQQFLGTVEVIRASLNREWVAQSLVGTAERPGQNMRWNPGADRNWALRATDPTSDRTSVNAPLEWLAFRALPLFPVVPMGSRAQTTCVSGRGEEMQFIWPLWRVAASLSAVRSLLRAPRDLKVRDRHGASGVFATCGSWIRRSPQGFGNFSPAAVVPA